MDVGTEKGTVKTKGVWINSGLSLMIMNQYWFIKNAKRSCQVIILYPLKYPLGMKVMERHSQMKKHVSKFVASRPVLQEFLEEVLQSERKWYQSET